MQLESVWLEGTRDGEGATQKNQIHFLCFSLTVPARKLQEARGKEEKICVFYIWLFNNVNLYLLTLS